jgi:hypothetical protein
MIAYHGSNQPLTALDQESWLSLDPEVALSFAEERAHDHGGVPVVMEVEIDEADLDWDVISNAAGVDDERGQLVRPMACQPLDPSDLAAIIAARQGQYETWVEVADQGRPVIRARRADGSMHLPTALYRVMAAEEFAQAEKSGTFLPKPGERIHASSRPISRYANPGEVVVVRFRYTEADGWRAKWGDELYAVTDQPIPFTRADVVPPNSREKVMDATEKLYHGTALPHLIDIIMCDCIEANDAGDDGPEGVCLSRDLGIADDCGRTRMHYGYDWTVRDIEAPPRTMAGAVIELDAIMVRANCKVIDYQWENDGFEHEERVTHNLTALNRYITAIHVSEESLLWLKEAVSAQPLHPDDDGSGHYTKAVLETIDRILADPRRIEPSVEPSSIFKPK